MKKMYRIIFLSGLVLCLASTVACKDWKNLGSDVRYYETTNYQGATEIEYQKLDPETGHYYDARKNGYGQFELTLRGRADREEDRWDNDMKEKYGDNWYNKSTFEDKKDLWSRTDRQLSQQEKDSEDYKQLQKERSETVENDWQRDMQRKYGRLWAEKVTRAELATRDERVLSVISDPDYREEKHVKIVEKTWERDMKDKYGDQWETRLTGADLQEKNNKVLSVISNPRHREEKHAELVEETWTHEMERKHGDKWYEKLTEAEINDRDAKVLLVISDPKIAAKTRADLADTRQTFREARQEAEELAKKPARSHSRRAIGPYNPLTSGHGHNGGDDGGGGGDDGGQP